MNEQPQHGVDRATDHLDDYVKVAGAAALEYLLADLLHWCDAYRTDFDVHLGIARKRHQEDKRQTV